MIGSWSTRHTSAAGLVRSMTQAQWLDSTRRTVVVHVPHERGALEALLDPEVLADTMGVNLAREAASVEAFACQLHGSSFHCLSFSLRPSPDRAYPATSTPLLVAGPDRRRPRLQAAFWDGVHMGIYDSVDRSASPFGEATSEEFLVQVLAGGDGAEPAAHGAFREVASRISGLATAIAVPFTHVHAPAATPSGRGGPWTSTGPSLRFGVAFPTAAVGERLTFGTRLVDLCCACGYGLWHRTTTGNRTGEIWEPVVAPVPAGGGEADRDPADPTGEQPWSRPVAITCVGPVRPGTIHAIVGILEQADAPVLGLSQTWLGNAVVHVLTRTRHGNRGPVEPGRADVVLSRALGLADPAHDDRLGDHRVVVSPATAEPQPKLAALWMGWVTPATPDALRLTVNTLRAALDVAWAGHGGRVGLVQEGHLDIGYLVCRQVPSADRLHGRVRVDFDTGALADLLNDDNDLSLLARFCGDVERLWRTSLSFALGTTNLEVEVVWNESWLGRWATLRASR